MPSEIIIIVIELMFLGVNMFLALLKTHFNKILIKLFNKNLTSEQHSANCSCITSIFLLRVSCD